MNDVNFNNLVELLQLFEIQRIFTFILGMFVLFIVNHALKKSAQNFARKFPSRRLLILQIITIAIFLIYIIGAVLIFYGTLRPSKELILALAGSIAVALGLALKDIVSSLIAGLVLLFDQPFQVGDRVNFNGEYGEIKSIGLRTVRLNTLDENLVTIPNSRFLTDVVSCGNSGNLEMMIVNNFHVALDSDLRKAEKIIRESIITSEFAYLKKPVSIIASEVVLNGIIAIKLKTKSYVIDVRYEKAFQTDIVKKTKDWFNAEGIKRPVFNYLDSSHSI